MRAHVSRGENAFILAECRAAGVEWTSRKVFFGDLFVSYAAGFTSARSLSFCGETVGKATFAPENGVPR